MTIPATLNPSADAVISAAIWSEDVARRVVTEVAPEVLTGVHATLYEHLRVMLDKGTPIEPRALQVACANGPNPAETCAALVNLMCDALPAQMIGWHIDELADRAQALRLRKLAMTAQQMSEDPEPNLTLLRERLDDVTTVRRTLPPTVASMVDEHLAQLDTDEPDTPALPTGLDGLDRLLNGGLRAGQLVVIGARTSVGKSVLLMQMARHAALRCDTTVLFGSLEMNAGEVLNRYIAAESRTDLSHLEGRQMTERDWARVAAKLNVLTSGRLHLVDGPSQTVSSIAAQARAVKAGLIVIDYLQLLKPEGRTGNRQEEVAALSRSLKVLAGTAGCPVVVASQLKRPPSDSKDIPKPLLSDLRESGAIEQDANIAILLHRNPKDEFHGTQAELDVAKNRSGPLGSIDLEFSGHYASFAEMTRPEPPAWDDEPPEEHYR